MSSCAKCGNDNRPGVKFCKFCGEGLTTPVAPLACVTCDAPLQAGAKFCKQCGTSVAADIAPPAPVAAPESGAPPEPKVSPTPVTPPVPIASVEPIASPERSQPSELPLNSASPSLLPKIAAAVCVVALMVGGGFYAYQRSSAEEPVTEAVPAPTAAPAVAPSPEQTQPPPPPSAAVAAEPAPPPSQPASVVTAPPAAKPAVVTKAETRPRVVPPAPAATPAAPSGNLDAGEIMARKVSTLLAKANGYVENKQYDKAIATAENVLEFDPGSNAARAMISKAKTKQLEALRSGSTLD